MVDPKKVIQDAELQKQSQAAPAEKYELTTSGENASIYSVSTEIRTVQQAIEKAEIDPELFEVEKCVINQYTVAVKVKVDGGEEIKREVLWQVKCTLRRKCRRL